MPVSEVVEGLLRSDGSLELDKMPSLPAGRVRVTLQTVEERQDFWSVLENIQKRRQARGAPRRTREEVDGQVAAMRQEWNDGRDLTPSEAPLSAP